MQEPSDSHWDEDSWVGNSVSTTDLTLGISHMVPSHPAARDWRVSVGAGAPIGARVAVSQGVPGDGGDLR